MSVSEREPRSPDALRVVVLSGPSGSGKTTIVKRLLASAPVRLVKVVSATTRPPRPGERDGRDYHFLNAGEFERRRQAGEFLETCEVHKAGYWYGTLHSEIARAQDAGGWAFLEVDVNGALAVMAAYPEAVTIFLTTPSLEEYERRLTERGTESRETIERRLRTAAEELDLADRYAHRVVNDDLDRAVREISGILARREAQSHA